MIRILSSPIPCFFPASLTIIYVHTRQNFPRLFRIFLNIKVFCFCHDWTSGFCGTPKKVSRDIRKYLWVFIEHLEKAKIKNECLWWWSWSGTRVTLLFRTLSFLLLPFALFMSLLMVETFLICCLVFSKHNSDELFINY